VAGVDVPVTGFDRAADRVDRLLTAVGLTGPTRRDAALAVLLAASTAALLQVPEADGLPRAAVALLVAQPLVLVLRRARPVACLALVVATQVALIAVAGAATTHGAAPLVAAYTCGVLLPGAVTARLVTGAVLVEAVALLVAAPVTAGLLGGQLASAVVGYGGCALLGEHVATRRRYTRLLVTTAADRAAAAVARERARMARELHDVAAHHLSGRVVQAAVVERLIDRDPAAARAAAALVRRQGKETLRDLRQVVGALRERAPGDGADAVADGGAPAPGAADLDRLVAAARAVGVPVELERRGPAPVLPPAADLAVHRVAQEALTNARRHAPGAPVRVALHHEHARVALEVVNGPGTAPGEAGSGFGLVGMRERAQLIGARLDAGPTAAGGWRVRLELEEPL
jgi:signal transduction histidine kinase